MWFRSYCGQEFTSNRNGNWVHCIICAQALKHNINTHSFERAHTHSFLHSNEIIKPIVIQIIYFVKVKFAHKTVFVIAFHLNKNDRLQIGWIATRERERRRGKNVPTRHWRLGKIKIHLKDTKIWTMAEQQPTTFNSQQQTAVAIYFLTMLNWVLQNKNGYKNVFVVSFSAKSFSDWAAAKNIKNFTEFALSLCRFSVESLYNSFILLVFH